MIEWLNNRMFLNGVMIAIIFITIGYLYYLVKNCDIIEKAQRSAWNNQVILKLYDYLSRYISPIAFNYNLSDNIKLYNLHINKSTKYHLEIGVASVHDLEKCTLQQIERENIKITLLDFVENPLKISKQSLIKHGYKTENIDTHCCDILQLNAKKLKYQQYNTIAMQGVLHCVPGSINDKLPKIIKNLSVVMDSNTILFGSTSCALPPTNKSFTKYLSPISIYKKDKFDDLKHVFQQYFEHCDIKLVGHVTEFQVSGFKNL